jgi:voltage-gated potassium channel Kch
VSRASQVIITTDRDDSTVLSTLNVRQLNPEAYVVAAVRESDNVELVRQSGADSVVTSSDAVGRLLGLSTLCPTLGSVMEDLLTYGEGLEVAERDLLVPEVGKAPQSLPDQVIAVVRDGLVGIAGDATRRGVLRQAGVEKATHVIITTDRDDSNVLVTLTVRQLNPDAWIVASVREQENVPLMRQSGANSVITSSDAVGRLLGLSSMSPMLGSVMEDLMTYGEGLEVAERDLLVNEVGKQPQSLPDQVIAVIRDEKVYRYFDPVVSLLARGDRLIVVRPAKELPWAPRPGTHGEDLAEDDD